jgi:DNA-binding Lrp family transcriptional regulator
VLDEVDLALLEELGVDGRLSFEKLSARVGLSRTAARARVQRLLESDTVRFQAIVHPAVDGFQTFAHVSLATSGSPVRAVADRIAESPRAPFVSIVAGRWSLIAELRTRDLGEMEREIDALRSQTGVVALDTVIYTDVVKDSRLPLGQPHSFATFGLDDMDRWLLDLLQQDARMPYADLAAKVGLSRAATRTRVLRLLEQGVVVVRGLANPTAVGISDMCGFQVQLDRDPEKAVSAIVQLDAVDFMARTIGRCDLIGTMIVRGRGEVAAALDAIRSLEGVRDVQAWWHLQLVKERYPALVRPG